jgi:hypothetical protein
MATACEEDGVRLDGEREPGAFELTTKAITMTSITVAALLNTWSLCQALAIRRLANLICERRGRRPDRCRARRMRKAMNMIRR